MMGFAPNNRKAAKAALFSTLRQAVAALSIAVLTGWPTLAEAVDAPASLERTPERRAEISKRLDALYEDLPEASEKNAGAIQREISAILSSSGSPTMDLILQRGRSALSEGDSETAIGHFTRLIDLVPDFAEAWNMRATAYYLDDQLGEAVADIEQVLAREPRHFGALWGLGLILERIGSNKKALTAFRAAFKLNPHLTDADETIRRLAVEVEGFEI